MDLKGISAMIQENNLIDEMGGGGLWGQRTPYKIFNIFYIDTPVTIFLYIHTRKNTVTI